MTDRVMRQRYAVIIDSVEHGPLFLADPGTGLPLIFETWEDAMEWGQTRVQVDPNREHLEFQAIRLQNG